MLKAIIKPLTQTHTHACIHTCTHPHPHTLTPLPHPHTHAHTHTHPHTHAHTAEGFEVQLRVLQAGGVQILASLPSVIPGSFILVVRYSYNQFTVVEVELHDASFSNTQTIQYTIPKDKLPTFTSFQVTAALRVNGVQGGFSEESRRISK